MIRLLSVLLIIVATGIFVFGQSAPTHIGKLNPQLGVDTVHIYQRVFAAVTDISKLKFSAMPEKGAVISAGEFSDPRVVSGRSIALLVEPRGKTPYIWFDTNSNGIFEADERYQLSSPTAQPDQLTVVLQLPIGILTTRPFQSSSIICAALNIQNSAPTNACWLNRYRLLRLGMWTSAGEMYFSNIPLNQNRRK